jgi:hypothetical protein
MQTWKQTIIRLSALVLGLTALSLPNFILTAKAAPSYSSPSYGVDEVFFGSGGVNDANSASYNARASLGDLGVGNSSSSSYQAYAGFTTTDLPFLEFFVSPVSQDLGLLESGTPKATTATFTVRTYLANGYAVVSNSQSPKNGSYNMQTLSTPAAFSANTEQFGINLTTNNVAGIGAFGANPLQLPDPTFAYGYVMPDYANSNLFKYLAGDIIAKSDRSTSNTEFTISYFFNISNTTPAGQYVFIHDLVTTSTF